MSESAEDGSTEAVQTEALTTLIGVLAGVVTEVTRSGAVDAQRLHGQLDEIDQLAAKQEPDTVRDMRRLIVGVMREAIDEGTGDGRLG